MILMNTDRKIAVIGGDARQIFCARKLSSLGFETALFGFDKYKDDIGCCTRCALCDEAKYSFDTFLLPLPSCSDGVLLSTPLSDYTLTLEKLFEDTNKNTLILYGKSSAVKQKCTEKNVLCIDYSERADFQTANAVPTAESALAIAINELPVTLCGQSCLVTGFGRIGKVLCRLLYAFGAKVTATARNSADLALIRAHGYKAVHTNDIFGILGDNRVIFNTIPYPVLSSEALEIIHPETLIIDLASRPGGVDFESAKKAGLNVIWALSLPGKYSPVSAGHILCDTVCSILNETEAEK